MLKVGKQEQTAVFEADDLVRAIHDATYGHPLFLALAAETVLKADALERPLLPADFQQAEVSDKIAPGHQAEEIGKYLLDLFLKQFPEAEREELIRCAVPRVLDVDVLRVLLPSLDKIDAPADERWQAMRRHSFLHPVDEHRSVVHPVMRGLLLRRLPVSADEESDFVKTHTRLRQFFTQRAAIGDHQAGLEEAYHALALGDAGPAVRLGFQTQQGHLPLSLWEPLLEAVRQAPTSLLPNTAVARARNALAQEQPKVQEAAGMVVIYTWLLSAAHDDREQSAWLQHNLGLAYVRLQTGDRTANLQHAIEYFNASLRVRTFEDFPAQWATTQTGLGNAYWYLPTGDRTASVQHAIEHYEASLRVNTREDSPRDWATMQNNLGLAYSSLPTGDRADNLRRAIVHHQDALEVFTREDFPADWAWTHNNLGMAHSHLPSGDRADNLQRAVAHYRAALQVFTRDAFGLGWAMTQNNLGTAYSQFPSGDRAADQQLAIDCYKAALKVYTREAFPEQWAMTQNNLGNAYSALPGGDRAANLQHAIEYFNAASLVYTREAFPVGWAQTQNGLGNAYRELVGGDRAANLQQAVKCYKAALQVFTRDAFPAEWAGVEHNLELVRQGRMDALREHGWTAIGKWGAGGWDLGLWPVIVVYHHEGAEGFDLAIDIDGDVTGYRLPTRERRDALTDEVALTYWKSQGKPWVEGVENADQMPAQLRGAYMPPQPGDPTKSVE